MGSEAPIRVLKGTDSFLSTALDAYNRERVSNPTIIFSNKNIHNRNKNLWEEPIDGAILEHGAVTAGPFQVAETITGSVSGTIGTVTVVGSGELTYSVNHDDFEVGETITGGTSGATATITTVGNGSTIVHDRDNASVNIQVGQGATDRAARITHVYIPHVPGNSQLTYQTFLLGAAATNVERTVGYGNLENGIFLNQTDSGLGFIVRSKTSGSAVDDLVLQNDWNVDKFDGEGLSGVILDPTKTLFLFIDFAWQGSGPVRIGFLVDGVFRTAHEFKFFNQIDTVFMSTPSLPIFYEIKNTGAAAGINVLKEFCSSSITEGSGSLTGIGFSVSGEDVARNVGPTDTPVIAIRLKNVFGGGENRKIIRFSNGGVFAIDNGVHFDIKHIHDPSGITATWNDIGGGSAVEFSTDISAITGNPEHKIDQGFVDAGQAGKGGTENVVQGNELDQHRIVTQDIFSTNSEIFLISAISLVPQTAKVYANMSWVEFD